MTVAMGNAKDMEKVITTLNEIKESIINAYRAKTGLSRGKIAQLMEDETWLNAKKAVELGFADEILFEDRNGEVNDEGQAYSTRAMGAAIINRLVCSAQDDASADDADEKPEADGAVLESTIESEAQPKEEAQPTEDVVEPAPVDEEPITEDLVIGLDLACSNPCFAASEPITEELVIGLDGKAKDGSMPYVLLEKQLQLLQ